MKSLTVPLRNKLENTVKAARDLAEEAAKAAIEQIGVHLKEKPTWLGNEQARLRVRLRAHGRQLGDIRHADGRQEINHLIAETAYEHWHRMLFARFLAENHLLIHSDGVLVSLQDCEELAVDEGASSGWELAGRYASRMLPQVFRQDSPVLEVVFASEHQKSLEKLLADIPPGVFVASDSLGWVYQFWQAKKKDEVNKSEVKIGADELPAVTQLFTEPYMVQFLLHNSLGAWWVTNHPGKICPVELTYLRTLDDGMPAAGTFDGWPKRLADLKMLDPCTGSGHFLIAAFYMLVAMRIEEDGLSAKKACDAVLKENLFGLEIDRRCIEIAAFNLALAAWTYPDTGGFRPLPGMNLACCGLPVSASMEEWVAFANGDRKLGDGMAALYKLFSDAPTLGSLINPRKFVQGDLVTAGYEELKPLLTKALEKENSRDDADRLELGVTASGLAKAAHLLGERYHLVATNVPYLARGRHAEKLKSFCKSFHGSAKNDLATVFLERCLDFSVQGGTAGLVLPQNWLFLTTYKKLREKLLKNQTWNMLARLGEGGFDSSQAAGAFTILVTLTREAPQSEHVFYGIDASEPRTAAKKAEATLKGELNPVSQKGQLGNPDARVAFGEVENCLLLNHFAKCLVGIQTGDDPRYIVTFWESSKNNGDIWEQMQSTPNEYLNFTGQNCMLRWEKASGELFHSSGSRIQGIETIGSNGICLHRLRQIFAYYYIGSYYHQNIAVVVPHDPLHLPAIWCFCSSPEYNEAVRQIDQSLKVTNATLVKAPFDLAHWQQVAAERYPNGLPKPFSDDPTQWIFHGHPCGSVIWDEEKKWTAIGELRTDTTVLHVAVARLLGYRWPAETDDNMELSDETRYWIKKSLALLPFVDDDGIVCIPAVRGEKPAEEKLLSLLAAAYEGAWSSSMLADLLAQVDCTGKTLEVWLRDKFFEQHFKLFHHRPFIWQIWDSQRDGFSALVNYHKLTRQNLEKLIYTYLGDWINRQEDGIKQGLDGARVRLLAAQKLKSELEKILEGEKPYDIFIRWKPLHEQPIGWEPDLNDGVRLNIRPFMKAGILRKNPNIKWNKDRGKDVESAPWYHLFKGDRINDHHLVLAEKQKARQNKEVVR